VVPKWRSNKLNTRILATWTEVPIRSQPGIKCNMASRFELIRVLHTAVRVAWSGRIVIIRNFFNYFMYEDLRMGHYSVC
jgi:hypothetical protein